MPARSPSEILDDLICLARELEQAARSAPADLLDPGKLNRATWAAFSVESSLRLALIRHENPRLSPRMVTELAVRWSDRG